MTIWPIRLVSGPSLDEENHVTLTVHKRGVSGNIWRLRNHLVTIWPIRLLNGPSLDEENHVTLTVHRRGVLETFGV